MPDKNTQLPFKRVYIGMPVYNGEQYLAESIESNLKQTFDDFGLIISDNASTDRTEEICRDYASSDSRIHYIRNEVNLGASQNYTCCFEPSNCDYFRWSNADDLVEPNLVSLCVKILDAKPDTVLAYGKTKIIDEKGNFTEYYDDNLHLQDETPSQRFKHFREIVGLSNILYGLMRREAVANTGLLGNFLASDINLIGELCLYGKFEEIPEYLFSRRMHPEASSWDRKDSERQKNFWDPSKRRLVMQTWRSIAEFFKAVGRAPISSQEKRVLYTYLVRYGFWKRQKLFSEVSDYARYGIIKRS